MVNDSVRGARPLWERDARRTSPTAGVAHARTRAGFGMGAVLAVAALSVGAGCNKATPPPPQVGPAADTTPIRVTTVVSQARNLPTTLQLTGTLTPDRQSAVTPLVSGRVMEVLVERGSVVREGQPMIRLRDADFRTTVASVTATLDQARARLGIEGGSFRARTPPKCAPRRRSSPSPKTGSAARNSSLRRAR